MSASFPNGTRNRADARIYAVATQERAIASMWNAVPIVGSAIFTADPSNGVRKPARIAIRRTMRFSVAVTGQGRYAADRRILTAGVDGGRGFRRHDILPVKSEDK